MMPRQHRPENNCLCSWWDLPEFHALAGFLAKSTSSVSSSSVEASATGVILHGWRRIKIVAAGVFQIIALQKRSHVVTGQKLSHVVFFKLKNSSPENVKALVDACHKYLKNHPGVNFFAAGTLATEYARPVNDHDFDVCLNVVFDSREAHDVYQTIADHLTFIAEHKPSWEKVRVFDADVT